MEGPGGGLAAHWPPSPLGIGLTRHGAGVPVRDLETSVETSTDPVTERMCGRTGCEDGNELQVPVSSGEGNG